MINFDIINLLIWAGLGWTFGAIHRKEYFSGALSAIIVASLIEYSYFGWELALAVALGFRVALWGAMIIYRAYWGDTYRFGVLVYIIGLLIGVIAIFWPFMKA